MSRRLRIVLHLLAGGLTVLVFSAAFVADKPEGWRTTYVAGMVAGAAIIVVGLVFRSGVVCSGSTCLSVMLLTSFAGVFLAESFFRAIGYDFAKEELKWRQIPPYYRQPTVPTGEVYFRRPGPETWTGQVLNTRMKQLGIKPNPYENEPEVTLDYDANGFRNPADMEDWEIVVAGDSFTELCTSSYENMFTTIMQTILDVRVLNLGTSKTGPLSQLSYLESYGVSTSTRHAVVVFFEGNDLQDLANEHNALRLWERTGEREYRKFEKQTSLLKAVRRLIAEYREWRNTPDYLNAYFISERGDVPVTVSYAPPGSSDLSAETMESLEYFFVGFASFAKEHGIEPHVAFMPCKRRVLHRHLKFTAECDEAFKSWEPTDLPELIARLSAESSVDFIDLTPALVRETEDSEVLLFNSIYDSHLTSRGSRVVAVELARHLASPDRRSPGE